MPAIPTITNSALAKITFMTTPAEMTFKRVPTDLLR